MHRIGEVARSDATGYKLKIWPTKVSTVYFMSCKLLFASFITAFGIYFLGFSLGIVVDQNQAICFR